MQNKSEYTPEVQDGTKNCNHMDGVKWWKK